MCIYVFGKQKCAVYKHSPVHSMVEQKIFANLFSHVTHAGCTVIKCFHYKENSKQTMGIQYTCTYILKVEQSCICI